MAKVTGLGGLFFKVADTGTTRDWYSKHLGIPFGEWGGWGWEWRDRSDPERIGRTEWSPFKADTDYFDPSDQPFMMNFRVDDLGALLGQLQAAGVELVGEPETNEYGSFAWIMDPNGIKIELWEPPSAPAAEA